MLKEESRVSKSQEREAADPVLAMLGVGKQLWEQESGDSFVERLRSEAPSDFPLAQPQEGPETLTEAVWRRIESHAGEEFHTATGLPFTFEVEGNGIWFFRDRRRINRKLARTQVAVAVSRCPLTTTTEIKDLMDFAYLFALLMDPRIRSGAW